MSASGVDIIAPATKPRAHARSPSSAKSGPEARLAHRTPAATKSDSAAIFAANDASSSSLQIVAKPSTSNSYQSGNEASSESPVDATGRSPLAESDPGLPLDDVSAEVMALLEQALDRHSLSARGFHRVLRVARTIADLAAAPCVDRNHIAEALAYRAMPLLA